MLPSRWVPWSALLAMLPAGAVDLMKEEERERRREELMRWLQDLAQFAAVWSVRIAQILAGVSFLFATATLLYSLLYYLVIPSRLHEQEIFFDYGSHSAVATSVSLPTATLNLLEPVRQWDASSLVARPAPQPPVLVPGVTYDVFVELTVPASRVNVDIGMFMVSTTLQSVDGAMLATSARPVLVHDAHTLVEWLRVGALAVPHALGVTEPSQLLSILAVNGFMESAAHPLTAVTITLSHPAVQLYGAKLTIIAQLAGVRYLMYHWSLSTAVLVILNIVFFEAVALAVLYAFYSLPVVTDDVSGSGSLSSRVATELPPRAAKKLEVDQGEVFEQHRSGGIPPVHVERAIKTEPIESSTLLDEAEANAAQLMAADEEMKLRFRTDDSGSGMS